MYGSPYIEDIDFTQIKKENQEFIIFVRNCLTNSDNARGKQNKIKEVTIMMEKLCTPEGKRFVHHYPTFKETVRNKMIEFLFIDDVKEANDWYFALFGYHLLELVTHKL